jgi:hypothetical protein
VTGVEAIDALIGRRDLRRVHYSGTWGFRSGQDRSGHAPASGGSDEAGSAGVTDLSR